MRRIHTFNAPDPAQAQSFCLRYAQAKINFF